MKKPTIHIDFETRSACELTKAGAIKYAKHPTTDIWCIAFAIDDGPVRLWWRTSHKSGGDIASLLEVFDLIESGECEVVAHNAPFELAIWNHTCVPKYLWPRLPIEITRCTMAQAYAMAIPASLERAAAALGIEQQKDTAGGRVMRQVAVPREGPLEDCPACDGTGIYYGNVCACDCITWWEDDMARLERVFAYCRQDVEVERNLDRRMMRLSPAEREVWLLDQKINNRGVLVDLQAVDAAIALVEYESDRLDQEMRAVTGGQVASCKAVAQLTRWIQSRGVDAEKVAKADVTKLLAGDVPPEVRRALELRQEGAKSSTAKLEAFKNGACEDGRMRGLFQYHGAGTGRWSGRRAQLQNMPRPQLKPKDIEAVFRLLESECPATT